MILSNLDLFKSRFKGDVIQSGDIGYDQARATMVRQGNPEIVLVPKNTAAVVMALEYVQENHLTLSIRSGGHSNAGFSTNDGGAVIDVSNLNKIEVLDKKTHLVRVGAGARWIDVATELQHHQLAISSGDTKSVGVGGLTLGGGIGWMVRKVGLTIDSLVAAEIVTADGQVLRVSPDEHVDLFWAIRGGGGNFGIVTNFEFLAQPVEQVVAGTLTFSLDDLPALLKAWRTCFRSASADLTTTFLVMPSFGEAPAAAMVSCCFARSDKAAALAELKPLLDSPTFLKEELKVKTYPEVLEDAFPPQGMKIVVNNAFAEQLSDELIDSISQNQKNAPGFILQIRDVSGALNNVDVDSTAFAHRSSEVLLVQPVFLPIAANQAEIEQAQKPWQAMQPFTVGCYINFVSDMSEAILKSAYPPKTYQRLVQIKKKYDPQNLFNQNCNIDPAYL